MATEAERVEAVAARQAEAEQRRAAEVARHAEAEQKREAVTKRDEANAVIKFLEEKVFAAAGPKGQAGGLGKDVTLRTAIAASLPALATGFAAQPVVEARLRLTLGATFHYLGDAKAATGQFEQVRAICSDRLGPDHPDALWVMHNLANSYEAQGLRSEMLELREQILAIQRRLLPPDHPDTLGSMHYMAVDYAALGRHADAIRLGEQALPALKRVLAADHPDTLKTMSNLAASYAVMGRHAQALKLREEALVLLRPTHGPGHPDMLKSMANLAINYVDGGRRADATALIDDCLRRAAGKAVDPRLVPSLIGLRGQLYRQAKDPDGCRAAAERWEKLNRPDAASLYAAACYRAVAAGLYAATGQPAEASADAGRAMAGLTKAVAAGYKDREHLEADDDLAPLRKRPDFRKLAESLPKKPEAAPPPRPAK